MDWPIRLRTENCPEKNWTEHEYFIQERKDVPHTSVKISCATTQFPELPFCGPHARTHGVRCLSKHQYLQIYPKLGH